MLNIHLEISDFKLNFVNGYDDLVLGNDYFVKILPE